MRPAAEDKQGRPAIEKRLDVWPCSLLRYEMLRGPHAASKSPAGASDRWRAYQRGLAPLGRRPQKACVYVKTLPRMTNEEAAG